MDYIEYAPLFKFVIARFSRVYVMLLKKVLIVRFLKLFRSIFLYGFNTLTLVDFYTAKTQQIYTGVILLKRSTLMTQNALI